MKPSYKKRNADTNISIKNYIKNYKKNQGKLSDEELDDLLKITKPKKIIYLHIARTITLTSKQLTKVMKLKNKEEGA